MRDGGFFVQFFFVYAALGDEICLGKKKYFVEIQLETKKNKKKLGQLKKK